MLAKWLNVVDLDVDVEVVVVVVVVVVAVAVVAVEVVEMTRGNGYQLPSLDAW